MLPVANSYFQMGVTVMRFAEHFEHCLINKMVHIWGCHNVTRIILTFSGLEINRDSGRILAHIRDLMNYYLQN